MAVRAYLHSRILRLKDAVGDPDIGARAEVLLLHRGLHRDRVVTAGDPALADLDVPAVVGVDPVGVRYLHVVADRQALGQDALATEQVKHPLRRILHRDVSDLDILR